MAPYSDDSVVLVCYLTLSQIGQEEKFSDGKGDFCISLWPENSQRNFETLLYYVVQGIFFSLYFLKSVNRKCVFSLKRNQKRPQEGLTDCSEIYFL